MMMLLSKARAVYPGDVAIGQGSGAELAYVGLGGNVGAVEEAFAGAVASLGRLPGLRVLRRSAIFATAPVGAVADQPWFRNACVELQIEGVSPVALLAAFLRIEAEHGRDRARERPGGPRPLDLDLLLVGARVLDDPGPPRVILPHPRLAERAFALAPLVELAGPEIVIPGAGPAGALLARAAAGQAFHRRP
jgi:2-amino-4-hydroxy-6-hydroxymethyldihydropteridine diphosphokinase